MSELSRCESELLPDPTSDEIEDAVNRQAENGFRLVYVALAPRDQLLRIFEEHGPKRKAGLVRW